MKKNRILAVALSAGLVLAGSFTTAQAAGSYDTAEAAKAAAEAALKNDSINKSYTVTIGADGKYYFSLSTEDPKNPLPETNKTSDDQKSSNLFDQHDIGNNDIGYVSKEIAEQQAKYEIAHDGINKSYEIVQTSNGRWSYVLSPFEKEKPEDKKPEDKKPEDKKPEDKKPENKKPEAKPSTPDYAPSTPDTKPATPAEDSNEVDKLIKDLNESEKKINDLLEQNEKENAELNKKGKKEADKKEADKKDKKKQAPAKQGSNPKTGVVGLGSVASLAAISMAGIVATRKRK